MLATVAGLALLTALGSALATALEGSEHREAALITFLVSASGVTVLGIGGAAWGLLAGGAMLALPRLRRGSSRRSRSAPSRSDSRT